MLTTVIVMVRAASNVPYYFETPEAQDIYAIFMPLRARAAGFLGMAVERSIDDLSIMHRISWESKALKTAFEQANAALMEELQHKLQEYNRLHDITRQAVTRKTA